MNLQSQQAPRGGGGHWSEESHVPPSHVIRTGPPVIGLRAGQGGVAEESQGKFQTANLTRKPRRISSFWGLSRYFICNNIMRPVS